jgi:hypothetical protein
LPRFLRTRFLCDTLLQDFHNVKVLVFEENSFALEITVYDFFLFFNGLMLPVNLLKKYLHEVDLAEG